MSDIPISMAPHHIARRGSVQSTTIEVPEVLNISIPDGDQPAEERNTVKLTVFTGNNDNKNCDSNVDEKKENITCGMKVKG